MNEKTTLEDIAQIIRQKNKFIIISHIRPDGDTLACAFSLKKAVEKLGKKAIVCCSDRVSERLGFICDEKVYLPDEIPSDFCEDAIISVDVASRNMLGNCEKLLSRAFSIKIDHHGQGDDFADICYTEPDSASCSEILFDLVQILECMTDEICDLLYTGISFDTGCFRHSNVTSSTFIKAAYLKSRGVNTAEINNRLFGEKTQKELDALKLAYNSLTYHFDSKMAIVCITNETKAKMGLTDDDLADISQIPIEIKDIQLGVTIKEKEDEPHAFKLSMRSKPGFDASEVCKRLGGGGHVCAAGGLIHAENAETAIEKVKKSAEIEFRKTGLI